MKRFEQLGAICLALVLLLFRGTASFARDGFVITATPAPAKRAFTLDDFYAQNPLLDRATEEIMLTLSNRERISQMVVTSVGERGRTPRQVELLLGYTNMGGVLFLGSPKQRILQLTGIFTDIAKRRYSLLPFYIIDGEPSLIAQRIGGAEPLPPAGSIQDEAECEEVAGEISHLFNELGIHINYAPVCDFSVNREVIGTRSFGGDEERVWSLAGVFIETMHKNGIVATVKHFPGHGSVRGDTHKGAIMLEQSPPELEVFRRSIDAGVVSVMVGHFGVHAVSEEWGVIDTGGRPSTISRDLVSGLLKGRMAFRGIVVTDAMNMESVIGWENPSLEAVRAGCDMILMPEDEIEFTEALLEEIQSDIRLYDQVSESVRKIVRLKLCLGLVWEGT
ncbi:MAG: glycoside hydrolase family 3 protein [Spirochaetes bacterium]|nr:glycoside hydrolase family 3 protein [Spirochaetota bacterium]